jgi:hypothetical protein
LQFRQKITRSAFQGTGELKYDIECRISFSALDTADVGSMKARYVSEFFLGKRKLHAATLYFNSKLPN